MATVIPPELCDIIIDCLADDSRALAQTSLTCRSWLPRSRRHLFRLVCLFDRVDWMRFKASVTESPSGKLTSCSEYVHELALFFLPTEAEIGMRPSSLLGLLKNVATLRLGGGTVQQFGNRKELRECFSGSLCTLHLDDGMELDGPHTVLTLLTALPKLSTLLVTYLCWKPTSSQSSKRADGLPMAIPIRNLDIHGCHSYVSDAIARWLMDSSFNSRLHTLHIALGDGTTRSHHHISALCITSGASLRTLHLYRDRNKTFKVTLPDLSNNTGLQHIYIYGLCNFSSSLSHQWLYEILTELQPHSFQELTLDLGLTYATCIDIIDWDVINNHLTNFAQSNPGICINFTTTIPTRQHERSIWPLWSKAKIEAALGSHLLGLLTALANESSQTRVKITYRRKIKDLAGFEESNIAVCDERWLFGG